MRLSLSQRETLYHELAQMLRSGFSLQEAAGILMKELSGGSVHGFLSAFRTRLQAGDSVEDAFANAGTRIPLLEKTLISAGAETGQLDRVLEELSTHLKAIREAREAIVSKSLYPLFLLHFGPLLLAAPAFILGTKPKAAVLLELVTFLIVAYEVAIIAFGAGFFLVRSAAKTQIADALLAILPIAGKIHRGFSLHRFCAALNLQLGTAVSAPTALERAANAAQSARIQHAVRAAVPSVRSGTRIADALPPSPAIPGELRRAIRIGEETGSLDVELSKWAGLSRRRGLAALDTAASWLPKLLNIAIIVALGWKIIQAYSTAVSGTLQVIENL